MRRPSIHIKTIIVAGLLGILHIAVLHGPVDAEEPGTERVEYFRIRAVDATTNRGIPLVELTTVNNVRYVTDSAGNIAFREPGLMNRPVFFHVKSHGYEIPKDGFGMRGRRLDTRPGSTATLEFKRINIGERLYRVTGAGIYRDSVLLGDEVPIAQPLLNASVSGSDSVLSAVYRGRVYWFWGDTHRPSYPLGNFHVPGATSKLPTAGGLDPSEGVNLEYFTAADGFAKETCRMPGAGPTWIDALTVIQGASGRERLFAKYAKIKPPLEVYERGLVEFNDETQQFDHRLKFDLDAPVYPAGHSFHHIDGGSEYVYFANPYPFVRVKATAQALLDPEQYECWSYFTAGSRTSSYQLDRDEKGQLRLGWKRDGLPVDHELEASLIESGKLKANERYFRLRDRQTKALVTAHRGSVSRNAFRQRWIMIFVQLSGGPSHLGEVWYAEADSPTGPWETATKILTHDKYSFYNPKHHAMFDQDNGRVIYFEGTYTNTFSGNSDRTPRYDYNQIMYRLDLSDPRLTDVRRSR